MFPCVDGHALIDIRLVLKAARSWPSRKHTLAGSEGTISDCSKACDTHSCSPATRVSLLSCAVSTDGGSTASATVTQDLSVMRGSVDDERDNDEDDVELAEQQLIARHPPPPSSTARRLPIHAVKEWLRKAVHWCDDWPHFHYLLYSLNIFILVAPTISLLIVNVYYFHVLSLSTSQPTEFVVSLIHSDLHTAAVQGEGAIDTDLLALVPANASALHVTDCGQPAQHSARGLCYSVAANVSGTLRYEDCAATIPVDTLRGDNIRTAAPPAEVNLYGYPCRPMPQGHPDMRTFNPYTVRCDLPQWVLARNTEQAPPPQPFVTPASPTSSPQPASAYPPLTAAERIPRLIFQTHARRSFLPPMQYWAMRTWIDRNVDYRYMFYDDEDVTRFIAEFAHPLLSAAQLDDIRTAAALLRRHMPMAAYADLLRYLLILKHGGVYVDSDTACIDPLSSWIDYEHDTFIIQDNMDLQWIIIAAPAHPIVLDSLLTAVHNVLYPLEAELSISPLYETTGPPVLLGAIARYNAAQLSDASLRPIRVMPSDPPAPEYAVEALTLYGRPFNHFQFSNHLLLKACEVEWEQRLYEHIPWVYKQRVVMAEYFYRRIQRWNWAALLVCVVAAVAWWVAYRGTGLHKHALIAWSVSMAVVQGVMLVLELPV